MRSHHCSFDLNREPVLLHAVDHITTAIDLNFEPVLDLNTQPILDDASADMIVEENSNAGLYREIHMEFQDQPNTITRIESDEDVDSVSHGQQNTVTDLENPFNEHERDDDIGRLTGETISEDAIDQPLYKKRRFLSNEDRKTIANILLNSFVGGKLMEGTTKKLALFYSVSLRVIQRIWHQVRDTREACHRKTNNCGKKRMPIDLERCRGIPVHHRTTLRSLSFALGVNKTSFIRYQKEGVIQRKSNTIKPFLKEENMITRLQFCLSMLEENTIQHDPTFKSMHNIIHIDEKWFYMTKRKVNYYLTAGEEGPHRTCKSKNFIVKVMFLVALARPRFDDEGNETFSGKIGVFPFVRKEPAKRRSVNRDAGTLETKPISSINKNVCREFLLHRVLPAIKSKWPRDVARETIIIQHDNAPCHIDENDEEFRQVACEGGFDIRLMCQPPNSPDLNVLDLGFFNAIQSLQHKEAPKTIDDLIIVVEQAYDSFPSGKSNKIFLSLQARMIEIMKHKGSNKFKDPHCNKDILERQGRLPSQFKCDPSIVQEVLDQLREVDG